jgi:hypothetical protein
MGVPQLSGRAGDRCEVGLSRNPRCGLIWRGGQRSAVRVNNKTSVDNSASALARLCTTYRTIGPTTHEDPFIGR